MRTRKYQDDHDDDHDTRPMTDQDAHDDKWREHDPTHVPGTVAPARIAHKPQPMLETRWYNEFLKAETRAASNMCTVLRRDSGDQWRKRTGNVAGRGCQSRSESPHLLGLLGLSSVLHPENRSPP